MGFEVRWKVSQDAREHYVEYSGYAQAEACLISLISRVDRTAGGWAEITCNGSVVLRVDRESLSIRDHA